MIFHIGKRLRGIWSKSISPIVNYIFWFYYALKMSLRLTYLVPILTKTFWFLFGEMLHWFYTIEYIYLMLSWTYSLFEYCFPEFRSMYVSIIDTNHIFIFNYNAFFKFFSTSVNLLLCWCYHITTRWNCFTFKVLIDKTKSYGK